MPHLISKNLVSTFSGCKVIAFFIFVYKFVNFTGKNIETSNAKRCGNPNKLQIPKNKNCKAVCYTEH